MPTYAADPRKQPDPRNERPERAAGILFLAGGLAALVISLTHPQGDPVGHAAQFSAWTTVHVVGALGLGLVAVGALLLLARGSAPNPLGALALAGLTVFGTIAMLAMAVDGFLNPGLASIQGETGANAVTTAFLEAERALAAFGYGGFGIAGALVVASHMPRMGTVMRIAAGLAVLALVAFAGAGIVYIGLGVSALGALFAPAILWNLFFVAWGAQIAFARVKTPDAVRRPAARTV